jgi:hypothetical protein
MTAIPSHFPRSEDLPESHPLNALRNEYINGWCVYFALVLAEQTGLELAVLFDLDGEEGSVPLHAFCCESLEGRAVDAFGVVDEIGEILEEFDQEWNLARPEEPWFELVTRAQLLEIFSDGKDPDPEELARARADLVRLGFGSLRPDLPEVESAPEPLLTTASPEASARPIPEL